MPPTDNIPAMCQFLLAFRSAATVVPPLWPAATLIGEIALNRDGQRHGSSAVNTVAARKQARCIVVHFLAV